MTSRTFAAANAQLQAQLSGRMNQQGRLDEMRGELYALKSKDTSLQAEKDKLEARLVWVATHIDTVAGWGSPDLPAFYAAVDAEIDGVPSVLAVAV
jgi:hypothetical protein